jgi:hypothetical protein
VLTYVATNRPETWDVVLPKILQLPGSEKAPLDGTGDDGIFRPHRISAGASDILNREQRLWMT